MNHPHPPQHSGSPFGAAPGSGAFQPAPSGPLPGPNPGPWPGQGPGQERPRKLSRGWIAAIVVGLVAALILVVVLVAVLGSSSRNDADGDSTGAGAQQEAGTDDAPAGPQDRVDPNYQGEGPDFPGRRPSDTSAAAGETIERDGVAIRADKLEPKKSNDPGVPPGICSMIRVENGTSEKVQVTPHMFVVVGPDGKEHIPAPSGDLAAPDNMLEYTLAPEEYGEGIVCFNAAERPEKGDYQLMYVGVAFYDQRLVWLNTL